MRKKHSLGISFSWYSEASILSSSELTSPFLMIVSGSNSHLSKFAFSHSWQEQRFSFPIVRPSEKKPSTCNFSQCKISQCISARWSLETTLQSQFGLPRCFCSKCFHLFYIIEKKIICDNTFSEKSFYPETAHRINQPFAMSWNTIIQNYSLILLLATAFQLANTKQDLYSCEQLSELKWKIRHWSLFAIKSSTIA